MKLHENTKDVKISGEKSSSNFRIATSSKAFRILSDGIYSDKIKAVIRELSTNAYDSHVDAGNASRPFDVHLPTDIESWFSVRDYGTGMSKEKIETLYTTYFDSDRNTSNDFTGALGLGSKSPFAYTDSFTVESYYNGEKYIYTCFVNDSGQPQVSLLFESETDQPNGVEVKFPISNSDFREFYSKAESVFYPFEIKPNITGRDINIPDKRIVLAGNGWEIVSRNTYGSQAVAIQGNVAYIINLHSLPNIEDNRVINLLNTINIDIQFPVGSLDVSASRESLGYDADTINNINNRLLEVVKEIQSIIDSASNKSKNYWEAVRNVHKFSRKISGISGVVEKTSFRGKEIIIGRRLHFDIGVYKAISYSFRNSTIVREVYPSGVFFDPGERPLIVINDEEKQTNRKCLMKTRSYFKNSKFDRVWIIEKLNWVKSKKSKMHNPTVLYSTKLPKPEYKRGGSSNKSYQNTIVELNNESIFSSDYINHTQVDFDEMALYIEVKNNQPVYNDESMHIDPYKQFLKDFNFDFKLYGIKKVEIGKNRFKRSKWVNVVDFVKNKVLEIYPDYVDEVKDLKTLQVNKVDHSVRDLFTQENKNLVLNKNSAFFDVMNLVDKIYSLNEKFSNDEFKSKIQNFSTLLSSMDMRVQPYEIPVEEQILKFFESYPLMKDMRIYSANVSNLIEYINAIDAYRSL